MVLQFLVSVDGKDKMTIDVCKNEMELKCVTVLELKHKIAEKLPGDSSANVAEMKLHFADVMLEGDSKMLSSYGLLHRSIIHAIWFLHGGSRS